MSEEADVGSLDHAILRDHKVVVVPMMEWARWIEENKYRARREAQEKTGRSYSTPEEDPTRVGHDNIDGVNVSTVFLGLNHSFGMGPPLWFETMVFGGELDQETERYETWEQAEAGHKAMVERVRAGSTVTQLEGHE